MKASAKPGCDLSSGAWLAHNRAIVGVTMNPSWAYLIAGSNKSANGSLPNFSDSSAHADTQPGTVTESQPRCGIVFFPLKRSGVQAAGERPEAFKPWSFSPSQRIQNASLPMPLLVGSSTVSEIAVARMASTALPPFNSMRRPAWAASGCEVATALRARTGMRCEG
jgi:hypothetical protein